MFYGTHSCVNDETYLPHIFINLTISQPTEACQVNLYRCKNMHIKEHIYICNFLMMIETGVCVLVSGNRGSAAR